jgi:hypothetical protein
VVFHHHLGELFYAGIFGFGGYHFPQRNFRAVALSGFGYEVLIMVAAR